VLLKMEIKDSLSRQGMQDLRGFDKKRPAKWELKGTNISLRESTQPKLDNKIEHAPLFAQQHKSIVTMSIPASQKEGFHRGTSLRGCERKQTCSYSS